MGGWNGSSGASSASAPKRAAAPSKKPAWLKGLAALLIIAVLGGGVIYFLMPGDAPVVAKEKTTKPSAITEVTPAPAAKPVEPPPVQMVTNRFGKVAPKKKPETYRDERGVLRFKVGNGRVPLPDAHKYLVKSRVYEDDLPQFKHQVETEIAAVLTYQPGDAAFGDFPHGKAFQKDFLAALMEPVEILDTDSEEDKKLKQQVEETKRELAERVKNGEDAGEILQEAREEMRRMETFKNDVLEMVHEQIKNEAQTTADIDAYYEAMNKMLESKGIEPVKMSGLLRRRIGYDLMKQQEEAAKQAQENAK